MSLVYRVAPSTVLVAARSPTVLRAAVLVVVLFKFVWVIHQDSESRLGFFFPLYITLDYSSPCNLLAYWFSFPQTELSMFRELCSFMSSPSGLFTLFHQTIFSFYSIHLQQSPQFYQRRAMKLARHD